MVVPFIFVGTKIHRLKDQQLYAEGSYPAKVLLFGEYGILSGGSGFAIPFHSFSGKFEFGAIASGAPEPIASHQSISNLAAYLLRLKNNFAFLDLERLSIDLQNGLWFHSTIPNGYGLGSSGALVAALYDRYKLTMESRPGEVRDMLSMIESYFHGASSGIDPLVAYFQKPVVSREGSVFVLEEISLAHVGLSIFLVDTAIFSKTVQLVDWFKSKMLQPLFRDFTVEDYLKKNQTIVGNIENGIPISFDDLLTISHYQLEFLSPMVPDSFRKHFFAGLESRNFAFKLCGSGGGGFMLCFAVDREKATDYFNRSNLGYIQVIG